MSSSQQCSEAARVIHHGNINYEGGSLRTQMVMKRLSTGPWNHMEPVYTRETPALRTNCHLPAFTPQILSLYEDTVPRVNSLL